MGIFFGRYCDSMYKLKNMIKGKSIDFSLVLIDFLSS